MSSDDTMNYSTSLVKSGLTAGIGAMLAQADNMALFEGQIGSVNGVSFLGTRMSFPVAIFVSMAVSNYIAELLHTYLLPHISHDRRVVNSLSSALTIGSTFASVYILLNTVNPALVKVMGLGNILLVVAGAEVVGSYAFTNWVYPWLLQ